MSAGRKAADAPPIIGSSRLRNHADISVASGRRFPSDTGAFADWVASSAAAAAAAGRGDDLSLGFNASAAAAAASGASLGAGLWGPASSAASRQAAALNYGMADVGMVVVTPAASFHHTHHHHHHHEAAAAAAAADPIFPLLSAGPCVLDPDRSASAAAASSAIQFWQSQPPQSPSSAAGGNPNPSASAFPYLKKPLPMLDTGGGSSGAGATTCQDCGNQAKKDCGHQRCRTCCKSRGYDCSTHVKSTWVPAARRRERQQLAGSGSASSSPATASTAAAASASKKPRLLTSQTTTSHTSTSNATTPRSFDTTSSHQDASFRESLPRQVRAPAVFRCVRVTSIDDGEDEYAYQATVTINGHVFKGFLYDQGVDDGRLAATSNDDSMAGVPNISELHLGGASVSGPGGHAIREGGSSMVPSDLYGGGSGGSGGPHILGGSSYGNTMN
ncbi:hypothetical protein E2562_004156 [Oryza meyeriana var. granulata]|uniref:Uncharacterized protein n=1 Tax=Oryza meyeriana var. granulata TaxID=110450 RepID=A0A6G1BRL7_9ORYZ|nr:hypothetical protein E2562_004156 [Oryza meyeriana var. granulata]